MQYVSRFINWLKNLDEDHRTMLMLAVSGVALLNSLFALVPLPCDSAWIAVLLCGLPIIKEGAEGLFTRFDIRADVLVSLALVAAVAIGEVFAAGEVAFIMQLGALLEELTVAKARAGIEKLVQLSPQTARLLRDGGESIVPAAQVCIGDTLRVLAGETVPVDGVITTGQTSINQAVLTGESLPVDKIAGDEVYSGTVNQFGAFEMRAVKVGEDSTLQRMIRLVQSADAGKAQIVRLADRWATWIVVAALLSAALTWWVSGEAIRAVTILVVFCPCALVLATPTAIMAAIGNATRHGFLVREGDALERLATVRVMAFDKTGTLTYGKPEVVAVVPVGGNASGDVSGDASAGARDTAPAAADDAQHTLYRFMAAAESLSEHPLGKAIVQGYKRRYNAPLPAAAQWRLCIGKGVTAEVESATVLVGNAALLQEHGITPPAAVHEAAQEYLTQGATVMYVARAGTVLGFAAVADTLRPGSATMIAALQRLDVQPLLLTGDHQSAARNIAAQVHITRVQAECLPEDKLRTIAACQEQGQAVGMLGDGINDAPALKKATVGIAMGSVGSDIAVEAADITLVDDNVAELPYLVALSRRMMTTIKYNLAFSLALNFLAIALASTGLLGPVMGALVHNAGSVLVIINSALLLRYGRKR